MRFATRVIMLSLVVVGLSAFSPLAFGQAVYGSIYGTATDATGAAVPGANVTVTDVAKGTSVNVQSDGSGEFRVDHLIPDVYDVKIDAILEAIRQLMAPPTKPRREIGFHVRETAPRYRKRKRR